MKNIYLTFWMTHFHLYYNTSANVKGESTRSRRHYLPKSLETPTKIYRHIALSEINLSNYYLSFHALDVYISIQGPRRADSSLSLFRPIHLTLSSWAGAALLYSLYLLSLISPRLNAFAISPPPLLASRSLQPKIVGGKTQRFSDAWKGRAMRRLCTFN